MRNAEIADAFDELAEPVRARRRGGLPRGGLPQRGEGDPRGRACRWPSWPAPGGSRSWRAWARRSPRRSTRCSRPARSRPPTSSRPGSPPASWRSRASRASGRSGCALLHEHLGVTSLDDLRKAAEDGRLDDVPGFGTKAEENVIAALAADDAGRGAATRFLLSQALAVGEAIVAGLRAARHAGSSSRAARAAWPTPARTSTWSRPRRDPRRSSRPSRSSPRSTWCTRSGEAGRARP